ncbi:MAG: DUF512 domain-containing protein [Calditrichaceae bacterium]
MKVKIMVKIIDIEQDSIGSELGVQAGDHLVRINGNEIRDRLDYRFYIDDELVDVLIRRGDEEIIYEIEKDAGEDIGLVLEEMDLMACGNNCVFCFVYQNPKGMRKSLYFKDEDYRYSFMYGHYVTMTTTKQRDLDRIVEQRLSPLYISVHATDAEARKLLLGIKRDDKLLDKIEFLTRHHIELHTQIVLCPGINDGKVFEKTVNDLQKYYPWVKSIAVVPLGLTQFREKLMQLRIHTPAELQDMINIVDDMRIKIKKEIGINYVYLSDEFFIKAHQPMPDADYYDEFYQIENGVGEFRDMIDTFEKEWPRMAKKWPRKTRVTWVTGVLASEPFNKFIIDPLRKIENLEINLVPVVNKFYGPTIQISGLLVAQDIYARLKDEDLGDFVLLPPRVLNEDGLFLDDWTVDDLQQKLGVPCHVYKETLGELEDVADMLLSEKIIKNRAEIS